MKRTLAALLALVTISSTALVACKKEATTTGGNNSDDTDDFVIQAPVTSDTNDSDTDDKGTSGGWVAVNYSIYAMGNGVNIRAAADDKSEKLGKLNLGNVITAVEYNGDDWYKVTYNGSEAYVSAEFVTRNADEATFESCTKEPLKIKDTVRDEDAEKDIDKYVLVQLRTDPCFSDATMTQYALIHSDTANGELVKVAVNKAGTWWQVEYTVDGVKKTLYVGSGAFKYFVGHDNQGSGGLG